MINKFLERRIKIIPDEGDQGLNKPMELEYYLIESEAYEIDDFRIEKVYGVEIVKKDGESQLESNFVRDLSSSRDGVRSILDLLIKNTVTPVGLPFIIEDLLGT